jgi:phosphonate transport system ATP-binding protein
MNTAVPVIAAHGLHVHAGTNVLLRDVSLTVAPGERVAIIGHNGAGKSTLLRAISVFNRVHGGQLKVLGTDVTLLGEPRGSRATRDLRRLRSRVAQVLQGLHLVGRLSVLDNVLIGGAARSPSWLTWFRRWPPGEREQARAALMRVGMAWAAERRTDSLSGGERQKVAIARALHQNAPVLLADEPTASLDAEAADEVIALLREVVAERQATLICVVHDLDLVPRLAERVIVLRRGQVVADVKVDADTTTGLRGILR